MDRINFATLSDFKRALKGFIKGALKSKLFDNENAIYKFCLEKDDNMVDVKIAKDGYCLKFNADVNTRIFNKITPEFLDKTITQFKNLKNVNDISINM